MYDLIAGLYSQIFPPDNSRCSFVIEETGVKTEDTPSVLDMGCATGDLAFELAESGCMVTGVDLDEKMIETALERGGSVRHGAGYYVPDFRRADMTHISGILKNKSFDAALCFGNTLPHLQSPEDVESVFVQVFSILKPGGCFIFQIINFDRIAEQRSFDFPDISIDSGTFRRNYRRREDGRIEFTISLEDRLSGRVSSDSVPLLPLSRASLIFMLRKSGFESIEVYSGYDRNPASVDDNALIFSARR